MTLERNENRNNIFYNNYSPKIVHNRKVLDLNEIGNDEFINNLQNYNSETI